MLYRCGGELSVRSWVSTLNAVLSVVQHCGDYQAGQPSMVLVGILFVDNSSAHSRLLECETRKMASFVFVRNKHRPISVL